MKHALHRRHPGHVPCIEIRVERIFGLQARAAGAVKGVARLLEGPRGAHRKKGAHVGDVRDVPVRDVVICRLGGHGVRVPLGDRRNERRTIRERSHGPLPGALLARAVINTRLLCRARHQNARLSR